MFQEVKFKDQVFNNLSEEARKRLDELVSQKGKIRFKRNDMPLIVRMEQDVPDESKLSTAARSQGSWMQPLIGRRWMPSEVDITDPFSKQFVKVRNVKSFSSIGEPEPAISWFPQGALVVEIDLVDIIARQTAGMFFLSKECAHNILGEGGKPMKADAYTFELWEGEVAVKQRNETAWDGAQLLVAASQLDMEKLRLLAGYTGFPNPDDQAGPNFMLAWIKGQIETRLNIVQAGFGQLGVLEAIELLKYAELHNVIYKDDATGFIRWNSDQQVAFFAYDRNSADQFRSCAEILVTDKGKETLEKLRRASELLTERTEAAVAKSIDELLDITPPAKDPDAVARGKALAEKARLAREAKKVVPETA